MLLDLQDHKAQPEFKDLQVIKARRVHKDHPGLQVPQVPQVLLVPQVKRVLRELKVVLGSREPQDRRGPLAFKVLQVKLDRKVHRDHRVSLA